MQIQPSRSFIFQALMVVAVLSVPAWYLLLEYTPVWQDHVLRGMLLNESSKAFWSGDLYPRWLHEVNDGLGSPVMLFQPYFAQFPAFFFEPLAFLDPNGNKRLLAAMLLLWIAGAVACYYWLLGYFEDWRARQGALLYTVYAPYGVAVSGNVIFTGNLPHAAVYFLIPFFLLIVKRFAERPFHYVPHYTLAQAFLCLAHLPTALIFSVIPVIYAFVSAAKERRKKVLFFCILAAGLGVGLSSIYWMVLLANENYIMNELFISGRVDYSNNFPRLIRPNNDPERFFYPRHILLVFATVPLAVCFYLVRNKKPFEEHRTKVFFFTGLMAFALFMYLPFSKPIWDQFTILHQLQFSGRFMILYPIGLIFLLTVWLPKLGSFAVHYSWIIGATLVTFVLVANHSYQKELSEDWSRVYEKHIIPENVHLTKWMHKAGYTRWKKIPKRFIESNNLEVIEGKALLSEFKQSSREISFQANVETDHANILIRRFYYPGWVAEDPQNVMLEISEYDARLMIRLYKGSNHIVLRQPWFPGEKEATLLSALCLMIWCAWITIAWLNLYSKRNSLS